MELYMKYAWEAFHQQKKPVFEDIPPNKAQLMSRVSGEAFDNGKTAEWMITLKTPVYRAVRSHVGHTIHVVSDRSFDGLTEDLVLGLKLMSWMSKRPLTWYWWDHDWERILPENTVPGKEHINGGWAIPGVPEVHVYRREEAHKVLLHETIHALRLDVHMPKDVRMQFHTDLKRELWPHLGEAFTEFFAEWLWAIAGAKNVSDAKARWAYQRDCAESQANIVWSRIHNRHEPEDTNVFAYYVLKWVLMGHEMEVILNPSRSVSKWFGWWKVIQPRLRTNDATHELIPMGMTCLI
jgi:hypothetical protein